MEIIKDCKYGYKKIKDIDNSEIKFFINESYWKEKELINSTKEIISNIEIEKNVDDLEWLKKTYYKDILDYCNKLGGSKNILDIGCGKGAFIKYMKLNNFEVHGLEPSYEESEILK